MKYSLSTGFCGVEKISCHVEKYFGFTVIDTDQFYATLINVCSLRDWLKRFQDGMLVELGLLYTFYGRILKTNKQTIK